MRDYHLDAQMDDLLTRSCEVKLHNSKLVIGNRTMTMCKEEE